MIPIEVFCMILGFADAPTLEALNNATLFDRSLHEAVLRAQWHTVVILKEWNEKRITTFSHPSLQILRRALHAYSYRGKLVHPAPATFIRKLEVLESYRFLKNDTMRSSEADMERDMHEQVSISSLLSSCIALQEICFQRLIEAADLESIIHNASTALEILFFNYPPAIQCWAPRPDWSRLSLLPNICTLTIGDMDDSDVDHLIGLMWTLKHLKSLTLITLPKHSESLPLVMFLNRLFSVDPKLCCTIHNLPPKLRYLALCEGYYWPWQVDVLVRPNKVDRVRLPYLEELVIDMESKRNIRAVLDWWDLPSLRRLTFQPVSLQSDHDGGWDSVQTLDKSLSGFLPRLWASLDQVVLLDVWRMDLRRSACSWDSYFETTDVVLGTQSCDDGFDEGIQRPKLDNGYDETVKHCENCRDFIDENDLFLSLQRLRIENIDFYEELIASIFGGLNFSKLRILMLYPWARDFPPRADRTCHTSLAGFREGRVAKRILSSGFPELRVLVIGGFRFYITPKAEDSLPQTCIFHDTPPNLNIRCLDKLLSNPTQAAKIDLHLDERDWVFINDLPPHPIQQEPWAMRRKRFSALDAVTEEANFLPSLPEAPVTAKHRNYLVLHPRTLTTPDRLQPPSTSLFYGKPLGKLHQVASWDYTTSYTRADNSSEQTYPVERVSPASQS